MQFHVLSGHGFLNTYQTEPIPKPGNSFPGAKLGQISALVSLFGGLWWRFVL